MIEVAVSDCQTEALSNDIVGYCAGKTFKIAVIACFVCSAGVGYKITTFAIIPVLFYAFVSDVGKII